jgi:formylglycine-generating enzyme required for sulfatase activity
MAFLNAENNASIFEGTAMKPRIRFLFGTIAVSLMLIALQPDIASAGKIGQNAHLATAGGERLPQEIAGGDGAPMVLVPAGEFKMGTNENGNEHPQRPVHLDGFYVDKYPVTNERFRAAGMKQIKDYGAKFNAARQPVVGVTCTQAKAYCEKAAKRLPTEAEWEKAAQGTDGREYPWGNDWDPNQVVWQKNSGGQAQPVAHSDHRNKSPYGAVDMSGNVFEWVQDWYNYHYYKNAPQ